MTDPRRCIVPGCGRPLYQSASYCGAHRGRYYRYGDPLGTPPPRRADLAGQTFGTLTVLEYNPTSRQWRCRCTCGAERYVRAWSLTSGGTASCGEPSRHGDAPTYDAMHRRLRDTRGPATEHPCDRCGAPAAQWSYRRRGARLRLESDTGPWSTDPDDYQPLCTACHKRADLAEIRHELAAAHGAQPLWDDPEAD